MFSDNAPSSKYSVAAMKEAMLKPHLRSSNQNLFPPNHRPPMDNGSGVATRGGAGQQQPKPSWLSDVPLAFKFFPASAPGIKAEREKERAKAREERKKAKQLNEEKVNNAAWVADIMKEFDGELLYGIKPKKSLYDAYVSLFDPHLTPTPPPTHHAQSPFLPKKKEKRCRDEEEQEMDEESTLRKHRKKHSKKSKYREEEKIAWERLKETTLKDSVLRFDLELSDSSTSDEEY